jgi:stage IV sporulation protein FB
MFGSLFYLWRFAGIAIYADISLVVLLVIWLIPALFPLNPEHALNVILFTVLLFGSITLHEFGHSLTARRLGYDVHRIVLNILGGAAVLDTSARRGLHEFLIAIAGPAVSVAIGVAGYLLWPVVWSAGLPGTSALIMEVAVVNFYLAIFNLLPAFPLDGGRVLRSILTPRLGLLKATEVAAKVGRSVAIFVGAYSVLSMLSAAGMIPAFNPISIGVFRFEGSPMMLLIAIYVYMAADMEYRMVLQEHYSNPFRWSDAGFRERDGDSWRTGPRDISNDVEVSPPPFAEDAKREKGIRGFLRRLFRR